MFGYLLLASVAAAPAPLTTVAEGSGFVRTGRYEEVEALCAAFPQRYAGKVRCERFGTTPEGRPMLALVASEDGVLAPEAIAAERRPVLLAQGGIHAGEIDGKDAGFWVLRELLEGAAGTGVLAQVTFVFVPVLNIDGHERFGPNHRPNQRGPEQTGWRVTGQNLNLNRDYAKAEAPEMAAMLGLLQKYQPVLYADLHVTDGAKFEHDVSVTFEPLEQGPAAMRTLGKALQQELFEKLRAAGHLPVGFYPSFLKEDDPSSGFAYGVPPPRFSAAYWSTHNRYGVLVETHSWREYPHRVRTTRDTLLGLLELTARHGVQWEQAARAADAQDRRIGGKAVALAFDSTKESRTLEFRGYAYTREPSEVSGQPWVRYDETKPQVWKLPYFPKVKAVLEARAPKEGYYVWPAHAQWVAEKLRLHGFRSERLQAPQPASELEVFRATKVELGPMSYEGRTRARLNGAWRKERVELPAGTLFVPVGQPGARLLVHLLEPQAPDSLAAWGFFNGHFEDKEYLEDYVAEEVAREMLKDPAVRRAFDEKLKDPAFAGSPQARLRFFYERHPAFDARLNRYPVFKR